MGRVERAPPCLEPVPAVGLAARPTLPEFHNIVIGDNATAVAAAAAEARRLGYDVSTASASHSEGQAEEVGRALAETALRMRAGTGGASGTPGGGRLAAYVRRRRAGGNAGRSGAAGAGRPKSAAGAGCALRLMTRGRTELPCFPAAPTARTARPTPPARCWTPMSWRRPGFAGAIRPTILPGTTPTAFSIPVGAPCSRRGRRRRTCAICGVVLAPVRIIHRRNTSPSASEEGQPLALACASG